MSTVPEIPASSAMSACQHPDQQCPPISYFAFSRAAAGTAYGIVAVHIFVPTPDHLTASGSLLTVLRQRGPISVLALARALGRDYKNVYEDVKLLKRFGLVRQGKGGVCVSFDRILMDAEIRLAA